MMRISRTLMRLISIQSLVVSRLVMFCLMIGSGATVVADEQAEFRFFQEVNHEISPDEEIVSVAIDSAIYAATRDGLPDIRILNTQGIQTPFIISVVTENRQREVIETGQLQVDSLRKIENDRVEIIVSLAPGASVAEGLRIVTPLKDYERHVQVLGSQDGSDWRPVVDDGFIFDYSRIIDVRNNEVPLGKNDFRKFKIVIDHITDNQESPLQEITKKSRDGQKVEIWRKQDQTIRPFRIDQIRYWYHQQLLSNEKKVYPVVEFQREEDPKEKRTIFTIHTRSEPLVGLILKTTSHNFNRRAVVEVLSHGGSVTTRAREKLSQQNDPPSWRQVGQATISDVSFRDLHRDQLAIPFPQNRQETYRILIDNQDNPPLEITDIEGEGIVQRLIFRASPGEKYRLYYGSINAQLPNYETQPLREMLQQGFQPVQGNLGVQIANQTYSEKEPQRSVWDFLDNKFFFGSVIAVMVVVLAWVLYRAGQRIEDIPGE